MEMVSKLLPMLMGFFNQLVDGCCGLMKSVTGSDPDKNEMQKTLGGWLLSFLPDAIANPLKTHLGIPGETPPAPDNTPQTPPAGQQQASVQAPQSQGQGLPPAGDLTKGFRISVAGVPIEVGPLSPAPAPTQK